MKKLIVSVPERLLNEALEKTILKEYDTDVVKIEKVSVKDNKVNFLIASDKLERRDIITFPDINSLNGFEDKSQVVNPDRMVRLIFVKDEGVGEKMEPLSVYIDEEKFNFLEIED